MILKNLDEFYPEFEDISRNLQFKVSKLLNKFYLKFLPPNWKCIFHNFVPCF